MLAQFEHSRKQRSHSVGRNHDVEQSGVDLLEMGFEQRERFVAVLRRQHHGPPLLEDPREEAQERGLVVDDEQGLHRLLGRFGLVHGREDRHIGLDDRRKQDESRRVSTPRSRYIELRSCSAFSFLTGASNPEELITCAADLGYPALALGDRDGVYGIPRFHQAAVRAGVRAIHGAEVTLDLHTGPSVEDTRKRGARENVERPPSLLLLAESPTGWRNLCRLLTTSHEGRAKDEASLRFDQLEAEARDLTVLVRGDERLTPELLDQTKGVFGRNGRSDERVWVDVSRPLDRRNERISRRAVDIAEAAGVPVVATGDVRCARAEDRKLLDALTCLYWRTTLDEAGRRPLPNGENHLRSPEAMAERFADQPGWLDATGIIAERCAFTLENLGYRFPEYPVPPGESQSSFLRQLTFIGARERYGGSSGRLPQRVRRQLEHELTIIEKLDLSGYFLIVYDISRFALEQGMLCQGRGSAANSAVCYALGITAVDPVGMDLLFERFLSEERGEWPDIDLDLPSGDQRELAIQYVFQKYGEHGAAMTANVITYRARMAVREMGKVLGMANDAIDRLSKLLAHFSFRDDLDSLPATLRESGVDPTSPRVALLLDLVTRIQGLPRHLGQHSGGVVIAAGRLDEVVPIEPATMVDRRVVQWDKEDCADLGIIKIDLLGLGMLDAIEKALPMIEAHEGKTIDLAHLPPDDPDTYAMIQRADTVGTFQIESRAQMATLPRMKPTCFYDLVVEIAIIRPGPIVGEMVHPYLNRRAGREEVTYPHPSLEPILKRTLGVPIFQEQILRIAMEAAGFSGGEAEELRRAMGFKRSIARMQLIEDRLNEGMKEKGLTPEAQETVHRYITAFALYGFPESHSASFALIAYASSYLKCHHPAAFLAGLLNAWPMGFYNPATLVKDAQRHGVDVRGIDVVHSEWMCTLEGSESPAARIGLRFASGMREETAKKLVTEREANPFRNLADLAGRVPFRRNELDTLAELGALASLQSTEPGAGVREVAGAGRRDAIWQVAALERDPTSLFSGKPTPASSEPSPLPKMTPLQDTLADYRLAGLTAGPQLLVHLRPELERQGIVSARALRDTPNGRVVKAAGHVIVRQRPGSGKVCFVTLEDETGTANAILMPDIFKKYRVVLHTSPVLRIDGPLQNVDGVIHVQARHLEAIPLAQTAEASHQLPEAHSYR
jgi:error-prone DNA polymerase